MKASSSHLAFHVPLFCFVTALISAGTSLARAQDSEVDHYASPDPVGPGAEDAQQTDEAITRYVFAEIGTSTASGPSGQVLWEVAGTLGYRSEHLEFALVLAGNSAQLLSGKRSAFSMAPRFGAHLTYGGGSGIFQPFIAVQLPIQFRSGAQLPADQGVALAFDFGARALGCSEETLPGACLGASVAMRAQYNFTDYLLGGLLPQGSAVFSFPVSIVVAFLL